MNGPNELAVATLVTARNNRSVLKLRLLTFTASCSGRMIFVFEGDDDKVVFSSWIARITPDRVYEPFVSGGKRNSRTISCILTDDAGTLNSEVALFVDRDFDDLSNFCPAQWIFMTDRYSVENYLVDSVVIAGVLRDNFPLDGEIKIREGIIEHFKSSYARFLDLTKLANFRLFVANRASILRADDFAPRLSHLVNFSLYGMSPSLTSLEEAIPLTREPTDIELADCEEEFSSLESELRYRGKFAYHFLKAFLRELCHACRTGCATFFDGQSRTNVREGEIQLGSLASRSPMPTGLEEFLKQLPS